MPKILSVSTFKPPHEVKQQQAVELTRSLFSEKYNDIERLLKVFQNGDIETTKCLYAPRMVWKRA